MKKIFTSILVAFTVITFAQTDSVVNISDDNFLQSLKDIGVDSNNDGKIQESEVKIIKSLTISADDLKGIEAFTNLVYLNCDTKGHLDLSKNTKLEVLELGHDIPSIDLSKNIDLKEIKCNNSQNLVNLDLSTNTKLEDLYVYSAYKINEIKLSNPSNLRRIYCHESGLKTINLQHTTLLTDIHLVSFAHPTLEISKNKDLVKLVCIGNDNLTAFDLSQNTKLKYLECYSNQLTSLDLTNNLDLEELSCGSNKIQKLDLSNNPKLTKITCNNNQLSTLDLTKQENLLKLNCKENFLLDVVCLSGNVDTGNGNFFQKDFTTEFSTTCETITSMEYAFNSTKNIIKAYNLQGTEVPTNTTGELIILLYDNGQTERVFNY